MALFLRNEIQRKMALFWRFTKNMAKMARFRQPKRVRVNVKFLKKKSQKKNAGRVSRPGLEPASRVTRPTLVYVYTHAIAGLSACFLFPTSACQIVSAFSFLFFSFFFKSSTPQGACLHKVPPSRAFTNGPKPTKQTRGLPPLGGVRRACAAQAGDVQARPK